MATIINTTQPGESTNSAMGLMLGIVLVVGLLLGLVYFSGVLGNRGGSNATDTQTAPANNEGSSNTTEIKVPDKIDVNVSNDGK